MEPFIAQIIMFAGNFAPRGWAFCNGQLLSISSNTALFSLIGTIYGGDGRTTFALPDLRGRAPIHAGQGPGLSARSLGQHMGNEQNYLNTTQMPAHTHTAETVAQASIDVSSDTGEESTPNGQYLAGGSNIYIDTPSANEKLAGVSAEATTNIGLTGQNQPINNVQPSLVINYIIALQGVFPSRS